MIKKELKLSLKKYVNLILFLASKIPPKENGKKKMYKLLFYIDFYHYKHYGKSITGETYIKLQMGPKPEHFDQIINKLKEYDVMSIEKDKFKPEYSPRTIYRTKIKPNLNVFSEEELETINKVITHLGKLDGKKLSEISHNEIAFKRTELKNEIDYDLAYLLNIDFDTEDEDEFLNYLIKLKILHKLLDKIKLGLITETKNSYYKKL